MRVQEIYGSAAVAVNRTENESNKIAFLGSSFFPNKKKMGLSIKWLKTHKGLKASLMPANFDAIPTVRTREGFKMENTELAFFRESMHIKEEDMMEIMRAQDSNDPYIESVLDSIYDDTNSLIDAADTAVEVMRMQLLATDEGTPKIAIGVADNTIYTYNYDPDGSYKEKHYMKLEGEDTWDNTATAKPLNDIRVGTQYLKSIGVEPKYALMNSETFDYLLENDQMKNSVVTVTGKAVEFMDQEIAKEVFKRKTGLAPLLYDKMYRDYDGTEKKFYPNDKLTIIGDEQLGNTWYGVTPEERTLIGEPTVDVAVLDRGVAIAVKTEAGPPVKVVTSVSQLVIPSYEGLDSTFVIDVK